MAASKAFDYILNQVKSSNLNFQIIQSPFSATISMKKSCVKEKSGVPIISSIQDPDLTLQLKAENQDLIHQLVELENRNKSIKVNMKMLWKKADDAFKQKSHLKEDLDSKHNQNIALNGITQKLELQNNILEKEVNELRENLE